MGRCEQGNSTGMCWGLEFTHDDELDEILMMKKVTNMVILSYFISY
jgi:hypothetical protein